MKILIITVSALIVTSALAENRQAQQVQQVNGILERTLKIPPHKVVEFQGVLESGPNTGNLCEVSINPCTQEIQVRESTLMNPSDAGRTEGPAPGKVSETKSSPPKKTKVENDPTQVFMKYNEKMIRIVETDPVYFKSVKTVEGLGSGTFEMWLEPESRLVRIRNRALGVTNDLSCRINSDYKLRRILTWFWCPQHKKPSSAK